MKLDRSFDPIQTAPGPFPARLGLRLLSVLTAAALVAAACQGSGGGGPAGP